MTRNDPKLRISNRVALIPAGRIASSLVVAGSLFALASWVPFAAQAQPVGVKPRQPAATRAYLDVNAWCADYRHGEPRTDPAEMKRLKVVQSDLAPGFKPGDATDGIALLAAYSAGTREVAFGPTDGRHLSRADKHGADHLRRRGTRQRAAVRQQHASLRTCRGNGRRSGTPPDDALNSTVGRLRNMFRSIPNSTAPGNRRRRFLQAAAWACLAL